MVLIPTFNYKLKQVEHNKNTTISYKKNRFALQFS